MQNRNIIKLALLGTGEALSKFINTLKEPGLHGVLGINFFNYHDINTGLTYQIWDLRGNERFRSSLRAYLKDATAVICFDFTEEILTSWKNQAPEGCQFIIYDAAKMTPQSCIKSIQFESNLTFRFFKSPENNDKNPKLWIDAKKEDVNVKPEPENNSWLEKYCTIS